MMELMELKKESNESIQERILSFSRRSIVEETIDVIIADDVRITFFEPDESIFTHIS